MTKLSVNINKIATLRNARGGNIPDLIKVAKDIEKFGAEGITVHPRPDERHIRYADVYELKKIVTTEFNIEGNPTDKFMQLVCQVKPEQVTLVPDAPSAITSNAGWNVNENKQFLTEIIAELHKHKIRTSIFVDTDEKNIENAATVGTDRIELYTESFADNYSINKEKAIENFVKAAITANKYNLGINAGHDLNLQNLNFFYKKIPNLLEVSIGHALITDAMYLGLEKTIKMYLKCLMD